MDSRPQACSLRNWRSSGASRLPSSVASARVARLYTRADAGHVHDRAKQVDPASRIESVFWVLHDFAIRFSAFHMAAI